MASFLEFGLTSLFVAHRYVYDSMASSKVIFARIRDAWARKRTQRSMGDVLDNDKEN
jgi:hypothetical protein